jgi:predicted GH43/DUF377 family glycosyl hydrolase
MIVRRFDENPIIAPEDVPPSRPGFEVVCAFNCAAIRVGDEVLLLVRAAERPKDIPADRAVASMIDEADPAAPLRRLEVRRADPDFEEVDSRLFRYRGDTYLTSISHLRLARSRDGRRFTIDPQPAMAPATPAEAYGIEDPRITHLDGRYWINYTAVSRHGIATALAVTDDFAAFERRGLIFAPENRDVTIFPERIDGRYVALHRPAGHVLGGRDIWLARSPDGLHWGDHQLVCTRRPGHWDSARIGGGAVPVRTDRGWIEIYHGVDDADRYCLGALLLDPHDPARILARSAEPLLEPQAAEERTGFFGNVVFTCGAVTRRDELTLYYGAADQCTCGATVSIADLLASLTPA